MSQTCINADSHLKTAKSGRGKTDKALASHCFVLQDPPKNDTHSRKKSRSVRQTPHPYSNADFNKHNLSEYKKKKPPKTIHSLPQATQSALNSFIQDIPRLIRQKHVKLASLTESTNPSTQSVASSQNHSNSTFRCSPSSHIPTSRPVHPSASLCYSTPSSPLASSKSHTNSSLPKRYQNSSSCDSKKTQRGLERLLTLFQTPSAPVSKKRKITQGSKSSSSQDKTRASSRNAAQEHVISNYEEDEKLEIGTMLVVQWPYSDGSFRQRHCTIVQTKEKPWKRKRMRQSGVLYQLQFRPDSQNKAKELRWTRLQHLQYVLTKS